MANNDLLNVDEQLLPPGDVTVVTNNNLLDVHEQLLTRKDDLFELVKVALRIAGLPDVHIKVIHLDITQRGPHCPAGETAVLESVPQPDGSIVFQWVCK